MSAPWQVVFLLDVDRTLRDNDTEPRNYWAHLRMPCSLAHSSDPATIVPTLFPEDRII